MSIWYKVTTSTINVYSSHSKLTSIKVGVLNKNDTFCADDAIGEDDEVIQNWKQITESSTNKFIGKYVELLKLSSGYNFTRIAYVPDHHSDDSTTTGHDTLVNESTSYSSTTPTTDENNNPTSMDEDGNTVSTLVPEAMYIDNSFMQQYTKNMSSREYLNNLKEGIEVKHIRGILGIPHQFLPIADIRTTTGGEMVTTNLGRVYSEKILKAMPLLLITPGIPSFMSSYSESHKKNILLDWLSGATEALQQKLTNSYSGKYYSLKYAYVEYFKYVNAMLRSAAVFLGIQDEIVDGKSLAHFNWLYDASGDDSDHWGKSGIGKFLGPYAGSVAFYADCGNTVSDSFTNQTMQSQLSSTLNSLSDTGRELNFLVGNVGSMAGLKVTALTGEEDLQSNMDNVSDAVNAVLGTGNIFSNILNKAQTILAGGRMVFPEIWSDSSFGRSYSCSMKLISPSGDPLAVYLNILVPIYHLLAMCLPRQSVQQSYFSPFLLRCYYKGLFNIDMGIMTGLSITKGAECEWTVNGIPTVADISFEIKDLYEGMFMSRAEDPLDFGILSNITELDYIANSCGININDQEVTRTFRLFTVLKIENRIRDIIANGIMGNITQFFNQQLNNLFGVF